MEMIQGLQELVWGPWMLAALLGMGVWLTAGSGWFQLRRAPLWWSRTAGTLGRGGERAGAGGITSFQTACTALAATIGTGNIVGVATALTAGGPGAIFWMWVSAIIGMMTAYGETWLGVRYRRRENGAWVCGPMVVLEDRLKLPALGLLYSFFCAMSSLGMGSMVQANSMAEAAAHTFHVPPAVTAAVAVILVGVVVAGGTERIASLSAKLIPAASGIYLFFSLAVILANWERLPGAAVSIVRSAFSLPAASGGVAGFLVSRSLRSGISRGVFSNEAGLGTLAILHGAAEDGDACGQGMWAMFEVFFDTIVICTLTALVILTAGDAGAGLDGAALAASCFGETLGALGEYLVSGSMIVFAFATLTAWFCMGRQAFSWLIARARIPSAAGRRIYMALYLNAVFLGCLARLEVVWGLSDILNGLMALPNLAALFLLRREVLQNIP